MLRYWVDRVWNLCTLTISSHRLTDIIQPCDPVEVISNASEKMLENNGHFLRARIVAEQRAIKLVRLQEVLNTQVKENNDLKVEVKTLK